MRKFLAALILLTIHITVSAHDLYLKPDVFRMSAPGAQKIEMYLTDTRFPGDPLIWRGDKTVAYRLDGPSGARELINPKETALPVLFQDPGTYQVGWEANVTYISINPETFDLYINLEGYQDVIDSRKKSGSESEYGRERYRRFVKTYVQVGEKLSEHFIKPMGFKIEIIPLSNPFLLRPGHELEVKVLFDGSPLADSRVMATYDTYSDQPEDYEQTVKTDQNGIARFKITKPGLWIVRANKILPVKDDEKADWESFWSNITFEIK
jgi:hypothetical protein